MSITYNITINDLTNGNVLIFNGSFIVDTSNPGNGVGTIINFYDSNDNNILLFTTDSAGGQQITYLMWQQVL